MHKKNLYIWGIQQELALRETACDALLEDKMSKHIDMKAHKRARDYLTNIWDRSLFHSAQVRLRKIKRWERKRRRSETPKVFSSTGTDTLTNVSVSPYQF